MNDIDRDLELIKRQETGLVLHHFSADLAWALGEHLRDLAIRRQLAVAIDIRRFNQPLFYTALAGTTPDNADWVRRKSNVVARFHRSSYSLALRLQQQKTSLLDKYGLSLADYTAHGGSFPLTVEGAGVIGSITVSGLPERQDHGLVIEALCQHLGLEHQDWKLP